MKLVYLQVNWPETASGEVKRLQMKKEGEGSRGLLYSQITSIVSVALVLLMLGMIASGGFAVRNAARQMSEDVGVTVVMSDTATVEMTRAVGRRMASAGYARTLRYVDAKSVLERWKVLSGEDAEGLTGENPFTGEWDMSVKAGYASRDSLEMIAKELHLMAGVEEVNGQSDIADAIGDGIDLATWIFAVVAGVLALISFVLISNTIRLAVYSRRLTIHAMLLVGATRGFIRRPFVMSGFLGGVMAATGATVVLGGAYYYMVSQYAVVGELVTLADAAWIAGGLYAVGALICVTASLLATNRYLRMDSDSIHNA